MGCAYFSTLRQHHYLLPMEASIFTAELHAILEALRQPDLPEVVTIFSDSKAVLMALRNPFNRHPELRRIFQRLALLRRTGTTVGFCWSPSHVGIPGNERADDLARSGDDPLYRRIPLPASDFRPIFGSIWRSALAR